MQGQGVYARVQAHYRPHAPLQLLKQLKTRNQALAGTTGIKNQNPLKTQKLTLTEKKCKET
jgi:hypothetical protein